MTEPLIVEMMSRENILWRCLHGGPLTAESIERGGLEDRLPWPRFRARNLPLLENLTDTHGACAVVARVGERFVGHLRFYPKAVLESAKPGLGMCLQQEFPCGPAEDFGRKRFPPLRELEDKTLVVHCLMLAAGEPGGESFRRKGIGTRMVRRLIGWAAANGWRAIEATAYASLPIVYAITGQAGRNFWEKLGFRLVRTERESALDQESDFVRTMREEASARGLDPETLANKDILRLDLSGAFGSF
jgi:hypothetical protein